jgi:hypothetical protein
MTAHATRLIFTALLVALLVLGIAALWAHVEQSFAGISVGGVR